MKIEDIYNIYIKCKNISTDTRQIIPHCLFFCLKGDNFDGNSFAQEALLKGADFAVIDNADYYIEGKTILVENVLQTLQELATNHREKLQIPIIGITGTNGKTTTKELLSAVLSRKFKVCATKGNLNNHIGVPLTLLSIASDDEIAIVEMGANHCGEIAQLCTFAKPNYGIITNIGKAHIEGFVSVENIIETKFALYQSVNNVDGTLFVNADDALLMKLSSNSIRLTYGVNGDVVGKCNTKQMYMTFRLPEFNKSVSTQLTGSYNFNNAMSAVAAGLHFGIDIEEIVYALIAYQPTNNRSQVRYIGDNVLIVDAYNANPSSMAVAVENLSQIKAENRVVILGAMMELGEESIAEHEKLVQLIQRKSINQMFFLGGDFLHTSAYPTNFYATFEDLANAIKQSLLPKSTILLKGSRSMKMERVLDLLKDDQ